MAGWHHQLNGHEFEQLWKMVKVEGNLACCRATEQQQGRIIPTILVGGGGGGDFQELGHCTLFGL